MSDSKGKDTPIDINFQVNPVKPIINYCYIPSLNYLAIISTPDISFATSFLGRFLELYDHFCFNFVCILLVCRLIVFCLYIIFQIYY